MIGMFDHVIGMFDHVIGMSDHIIEMFGWDRNKSSSNLLLLARAPSLHQKLL